MRAGGRRHAARVDPAEDDREPRREHVGHVARRVERRHRIGTHGCDCSCECSVGGLVSPQGGVLIEAARWRSSTFAGREREPQVLELIEPDPAWTVVGWSATTGSSPARASSAASDDEVAIRALGARRRLPMRVALLDAIAGVATGSRLVADVSERVGELYRRGGFIADERRRAAHSLTRLLEEPAARTGASIRAATLWEARKRDPRRVGTRHLGRSRRAGPRRIPPAASAR